jgi:hypothetical protein
VLFVNMLAFSGLLVLFTVSRSFVLSLGLLVLAGMTTLTFGSMLQTMLQLRAPGAMRGRVMSLVTVTMQGFAPLGALLTGAMATAVGTPLAVALSAVVVAVAAVAAALCAPDVRDYAEAAGEREERASAPATVASAASLVPPAPSLQG